MKRTFLFILILATTLSILPAQNDRPAWLGSGEIFKLEPFTDGILFGTGLALNGTYLLCDKVLKTKEIAFDGNILDKSTVNGFDRPLMNAYSKTLDTTGDIFLLGALASPVLFAAAPNTEWFTIAAMYTETALIANGIKDITKLIVDRPRPYMYFDGYPQKEIEERDWCKSFPSGHTTMAFTAAAFNTYVFSKYFPDSPWRFVVTGGSYAIAVTTAALRLASGNHFATDVLTGAAIGTLCGFLVPYLHTLNTGKADKQGQAQTLSAQVVPNGFYVTLTF